MQFKPCTVIKGSENVSYIPELLLFVVIINIWIACSTLDILPIN